MEQSLLLLFDRPTEPIYVPKGEQRASFDIPSNYLPERYQPIAQRILNRFGNESLSSIPIKQISIPDLSIPLGLSRYANFSPFILAHRKMSAHLTKLFIGMRTIEDLISLSAYCRDRINPQMFVYSLSVALLHRPDTKHLQIPQLSEIFPDKFIDSTVFTKAKEEANIVPEGSRTPIEIPLDWTATDADPEHRVAYFREDVGVNVHHWHWHLVYPLDGPEVVVNKDRRGELFYYMHHQFQARYNVERFCNGLRSVRPLSNLREPISEGYFPKMDQVVSGRAWPGRPIGMNISDLMRRSDGIATALSDMELWRDNILNAIRTRQVRTAQGQIIKLDDFNGIDILGNLVESSILSPDKSFYGDLHNQGHMVLGYIHDPDHRFLESFGTMGDPSTSMRDPVFYRWHQFIDDLFTVFKDSLPSYSIQQLNFPGVTVSDIRIDTPGSKTNSINCHWTKSDVDLSRGMDFTPRGSVLARIQHLNHDDFSYNFVVNNSNIREVTGTIRVFMAPKFDEAGRLLSVNDQRLYMIEMDKFTTKLRRGQNIITRSSLESSVTIPFEAIFRNVDTNRPTDIQALDRFNFCGCGWPQYMLVPKGTIQGYPMDLFIMVSDYDIDKVDQPEPTGCRTGVSFCGLRDRKWPDARSMGYPFDRVFRQGVGTVNEFLTPNMKLQKITVKFNDIIKPRQPKNFSG